MEKFNIEYDVNEWRLFIDSSKRSLTAALLHNGSKYAPVPVGHSVHLKERYKNLALVLTKLNYKDHRWMICGDLKVLSMLLGQQSGYTKYPCFLCEWDSRAKSQHWTQKQCLSRAALKPGDKIWFGIVWLITKSTPTTSSYAAWTDEAVCKSFAQRRRVF
jgi:hypothetical protein